MSSILGTRRGRVFGGNAGIWFRKRKVRGTVAPQQDGTPSTPSVSTKVVSSDDCDRRNRCEQSQVIIGWDEVLCRPIYKKARRHSAPVFTSSPTSPTADSPLQPSDTSVTTSIPEASPFGAMQQINERILRTKRNGRRAYYGNKRPAYHYEPLLPLTPDAKKPRLLDTKPSIQNQKTPVAVTDLSNNDTEPKQHSESVIVVVASTPQPPSKKKVTPNGINEDEFEFTPQQPSALSSLASAQAFFARLDAMHPLKLDSAKSPAIAGRRTVRTTRAVRTNCPKLRREYQQYETMCREARVTPMPLRKFASVRGTDFGLTLEGCLDE